VCQINRGEEEGDSSEKCQMDRNKNAKRKVMKRKRLEANDLIENCVEDAVFHLLMRRICITAPANSSTANPIITVIRISTYFQYDDGTYLHQ
jgi:hypothetical protein